MTAPRRVWLTGLMGAGKSTVGLALAQLLGWPYVDNDVALALLTGRQLAAWEPGDALHDAEARVLSGVAERTGPLIAGVSGGCADRLECLRLLRNSGFVVYLHVPVEVLRERVWGTARPVAGEQVAAQYRCRDPLYRQAADLVVESVDAPRCAAAIVAALESSSGDPVGNHGAQTTCEP